MRYAIEADFLDSLAHFTFSLLAGVTLTCDVVKTSLEVGKTV